MLQSSQLNQRNQHLQAGFAELLTEEDSMERKMILNCIYANDFTTLQNNSRIIMDKSLNWLEPHPRTDLDELVTPLTCAAFLGRLHILELLLEN